MLKSWLLTKSNVWKNRISGQVVGILSPLLLTVQIFLLSRQKQFHTPFGVMKARIINILTVLRSAIEFQTTHNVAKTNF